MPENFAPIAESLGVNMADLLRRMERRIEELESESARLGQPRKDAITFRVQAKAPTSPHGGEVVTYTRGVAGSESMYIKLPNGTEVDLGGGFSSSSASASTAIASSSDLAILLMGG